MKLTAVAVALVAALASAPAAVRAGGAAPASPAAVRPDLEAILFVRIPNKPNGRPGIHYEPFMFHFGESAHVPGAQIVKLSPPRPDGKITVLTADFFAVEEPELSYDAKKVLFAGKKTARDPWEVWEMDVDGSNKRQITKGMGDVCSPCYLPDGRILFSSTRHVAMKPERNRDEYDRDHARLAHRCNPDGSGVEQITFNVSSDSEFIVLRDGRVLFQSWQHHGMRFHTSGASAFFTMNPDGTGFLDYYGNHFGNFRWKQREMPDGRIIYVDSVFHHCFGGGWLGMITPDDPNQHAQNLTPDVQVYSPKSPGGRYRDPYPTPDGRVIVSWSPAPTWSDYMNPGGPNCQFSLYWFDFDKKKVGAPIYTDSKYQALNAIPLSPTPKPRIVPDHGLDYSKKTGTLLCLNAYLGQLDKEEFIKPGQIKKVRIIEGFGINDADPFFRTFPPGIGYASFGSSSNSISNFEQKRIVGEAPVEADGSFYVEVPADAVLHWQVLDDKGMALQDALTWAWVRPGERRLCIGCHEDRKTTPTFSTTPLAARKPPVHLDPPEDQRPTIDFRRDLVPIIEAECTRCHNEQQKEAGLDLSGGNQLHFQRVVTAFDESHHVNIAAFNKAYLNLSRPTDYRLGRYIFPGFARKSPLIWRLYGESFVHNAKVNRCPPDKPLSDDAKAKFALWVDLGAQWDNIPGPDQYLSFSARQNRKLVQQSEQKIPAKFTDPAAAAEVRCLQCHSLERVLAARKKPEEWRETVKKMHEKNAGWIKAEEIDLIANYLVKITADAGLFRDWNVCGPFDNSGFAGLRNVYPPEQEINLTKTYPGKDGKPVGWKQVQLSDPTAVLNLQNVVGNVRNATLYAYATLPSELEKTVYLRIGSSDVFELTVNGKKVLQRLMQQPFRYDWEELPVRLQKGQNTLLFKILNTGGGCVLRARLTETSSPVAQAAVLTAPKQVALP